MNALRKQLINRMSRLYGVENPIISSFRSICESWSAGEEWDKGLETLVKCHEMCPMTEGDE